MGIQQLTLGLGTQQGLVRMLAMNIHQCLGHIPKLLHGHRSTIDISP